MTTAADKIKGKHTRELSFKREAVDVETRTVKLAFSSELPYERWFGFEILDHGAKSIRLGRLEDGAPLLLNHDPDSQIGVVESVEIGADRVGRAVVRFGKSEDADEIFQDVVDGIRKKVSVGYTIHSLVVEAKKDGAETFRVTDWEPYEISIVSVPADNSVGVGRALDKLNSEEKKMNDIQTQAPAPAPVPATPAVDVRAVTNAARDAEISRIREMDAVGQRFAQFGGVELARKHIAEGKNIDDLQAAILEAAGARKATATDTEIGMTNKEKRDFSFIRAINALANPLDRKAQEAAAFEFEASRAAADKLGRESRGITIPMDVLNAKRDMEYGVFANGGAAVNQQLLTGSFIDALRNRLITQAAGAQILAGLTGEISIPRQTGVSQAYWVGEGGAPTESQPALGQIKMSPKTVAAYTDLTRRVMNYTTLDMESFVRNDIMKQMGIEIDRAALYGTASNSEPMGLRNTTGILTQTVASAGNPTFAEIVGFESKVAAQNADFGALCYVTTPTVRGNMKSTPKVSGQPIYVWGEGTNPVNGYRGEVSNQIASNEIWFGNWSDLVIGFYSGLDLMVDPFTFSNSGTVRVVAMQDLDVAVRRAISFCRSA